MAFVPIRPKSEEDFRAKMKEILSVEGVLSLSKSFVAVTTKNRLECVPCRRDGSKRATVAYNFTAEQLVFEVGKLSKGFSQLKDHVVKHIFNSKRHCKLASPLPKSYKPSKKEYEIGMKIGQTILGLLQDRMKYCQLRKELYKLWTHKLDVGDINHSPRALRNFVPCLYECQRGKLAKTLSTPNQVTDLLPFISLTADKVTLNDTIYHVVGLYSLRPEGIRPTFLQLIESAKGDGLTMAQEIVAAVLDVLRISKQDLKARYEAKLWPPHYMFPLLNTHNSI